MGAVPVIVKGPLDPLMNSLPVLIVNGYDSVNASLLEHYATNPWPQTTQKAWALFWHHELQRQQLALKQGTMS